jgi:hypothetical protein
MTHPTDDNDDPDETTDAMMRRREAELRLPFARARVLDDRSPRWQGQRMPDRPPVPPPPARTDADRSSATSPTGGFQRSQQREQREGEPRDLDLIAGLEALDPTEDVLAILSNAKLGHYAGETDECLARDLEALTFHGPAEAAEEFAKGKAVAVGYARAGRFRHSQEALAGKSGGGQRRGRSEPEPGAPDSDDDEGSEAEPDSASADG